MSDLHFEQVFKAVAFLQSKNFRNAETGFILGTGLSGVASEIRVENEIFYQDIPHFPVSTVESHLGKLVYGTLAGSKVLAMVGRFHYYEGYSMSQIAFPVRVMKFLGVNRLLLSNAAGALNPAFKKGSLMLLNDHLNLLPSNPLIGQNDPRFGTRFPDMSRPYDKKLNDLMKQVAERLGITLHEGVYAAVPGPNLETRAEYRFLRNIGADAVGMSTVPEVITARHLGLACAAVSVLTDECDPDNLQETDISQIIEAARLAEGSLTALFKGLMGVD